MTKSRISIILLFIVGLTAGFYLLGFFSVDLPATADDLSLDDQDATIMAIKKVQPAVVSIIVYDWDEFIAIDSPSGQKEIKKYKKQKIRGTGTLISADGYILTNKHITAAANPLTGEYRIILNSGQEYYAQYIGDDPLNDLAVLKIFDKDLPFVELGDSDKLEVGMTVIAIGNALGRYENSATKGIVSALGRTLNPSNYYGTTQELDNAIQTDAKINPGNSGGPLADLKGKVVGINTAIESTGSAIGFAIPINDVRQMIAGIRTSSRIVRPRIGVKYAMITPEIAKDNKLPSDYGAWITSSDNTVPAVIPDSPAAKAGVAAGDIILEVNAIKIDGKRTLQSIIQRYKPGDKIGLRILRGKDIVIKVVTLDELK